MSSRPSTKRYRDYDPFAWLYTTHWGDEFHQQIMPVLDRLFLNEIPAGSDILDLCCGDGRVTRQLLDRGYHVTGVDGSEQMLSYAKQRCPEARFLLSDARTIEFSAEFDAVVSTFDSLNHVMRPEDLKRVFENVFDALKTGGQFAFDLNREEAYGEYWARTSHTITPEAVSLVRGFYDPTERRADCEVTLFRLRKGNWERTDFRLMQRYHPAEQVLPALEGAGFEARVFDAARDLGMRGDIGFGRSFFLARKPGKY